MLFRSVFCVAIIISVTRSVTAMTPPRTASTEPVLTYRECLDGADTLWSQLETQRANFGQGTGTDTLDRRWADFRAKWLQRLHENEAHCALESHSKTQLKEVYGLLEQVQDLYSVHAAQYSGDVAPKVDRLREALSTARRSPEAGRLP